ncbi:F-box/WD repeat-containing protein 5-like isoform X2 [Littorina saxatilis]|uniref:F-box domain-containing protein n=2 Tax=Littorina saxatilis TaxID=31220 RepID=A0AAN9G4P3_9CAEN
MGGAQTLSVLDLPDSLHLKVFMSLLLQSVRCVSLTCSRLRRIALDQQLWKTMFQRDFKVPESVPLSPQASSWRAEYRRLYDESPAVLCEEVLQHKDEVLNVTFSHNGEMFATCSKDGTVKVWNARTPCTLRFTADMKARFQWRYTRSSQFNKSGTLLLVVGVLDFGLHLNGEVAVFDLEQDFRLVSRSLNAPNDWYSAWYDDCHILTGTLCRANNLESTSAVWLTKASRAVTSERKYATINPFRFKNCSSGHVRMMIVADVTMVTDESQSASVEESTIPTESGMDSFLADSTEKPAEYDGEFSYDSIGATGCAHHSVHSTQDITASLPKHNGTSDILSSRAKKLLIFTLSKEAYDAHIVGIKQMTEEEIRREEEAIEGLQWPVTEDGLLPRTNRDIGGSGCVSEVDYTFNMHGQIIGMALSPDQRYLYVNCRRWLVEDEDEEEMNTPPLSQEIDIHVFDLLTFTKIDTVLRSHKASFSNAAFIYLNVNDLFVVSGAEDSQGYMWDRHYGVHVRCFPHDNVVSSCAFNPVDPEMLVTASDDNKIKIWRSRRQMREMYEKKYI